MKGETEIKAKLYGVVESYYNSLDVLAKKLQDDYAGIKSFEQSEEDRLGLCFLLDYTDDLREEIKALHENERMISAEKRLKINEDSLREIWDNIKCTNIPEEERKGQRKYLKK